MQGGEQTKAGRKLAAAAAAVAAAAETSPVPLRAVEPEPPQPAEKAAVAAAEMEETAREERAAAAEPATISRSVSVIVTEVTESRLRLWRKAGSLDGNGELHRVESGAGGREGLGGVEARMSLSDVKLFTGTARCVGGREGGGRVTVVCVRLTARLYICCLTCLIVSSS